MASSTGWQMLDLAHASAPKLLLKPHVTLTGYHVQLTDLCRVWSEQLCKRDILRRACEDGCSIDPSEDDKQFSIFLEKVESALRQEKGTTIDLVPSDSDGLLLKLSAPMPKSFETFRWTISLTRCTDEALAEALTFPLLRQASGLQSQVRLLVHELQEKDRVISKITDRLETSGNDLNTVFPGVSNIRTNKKRSQREQLARHVRGLADFNEAEWRSKTANSETAHLWEEIDGVLSGLPAAEAGNLNGPVKQNWWLDLSQTLEARNGVADLQETAISSGQEGATGRRQSEDSVIEDEFRRQATSNHLRRQASDHVVNHGTDQAPVSITIPQVHQQPEMVDDDGSTTEDEDDLDATPKSRPSAEVPKLSPRRTSKSPSTGPPRKLGTIGGRLANFPRSPAKEHSPAPEQVPQPSTPRAKLGALGGRAKATVTPTSASPPPEDHAAPEASSARRKMGVIGGKHKQPESVSQVARSPKATPSPESARERSRATTKEPTPPPRETSQERADQRRDQLKRELEQKSKAPAKKKRRF